MEQIKIDLVPNGVMSVAHASQFDVGRSMKFLLTDEGVTYTLAGTEVITMKLRKPDGTDDTISLVNTSSSYVEWTTVDGDLDLFGVYLAEITITSGDDVLGTANFLLKVEPDPYNGKNIRIVTVGPADICTFETTLPEPYQSVTVNVVATGGNGTPDNPNPIVGYSSANITRCGVNLWDEVTEVGTINSTTGENQPYSLELRTKNYTRCTPNTTYYNHKDSGGSGEIYYYDENKTYIGNAYISKNATFTTPNNAHFFRFRLGNAYGTTYNNDISINYPSSDTSYHAYNGQTYTIAFGQTVYGGVLDVTRGKLHVTQEKDSFSDKSFTQYSTGFFAITSYTSAKLNGTGLCEIYTVVVDKSYANAPDNSMQFRGNQILIKDTSCADVTALIARTGSHEFTYELATPFDIDLTPTQIRALVGENNVFAGCGETTVEYMAEV